MGTGRIVDLYEAVGKTWTTAALLGFGLAFMIGGLVGWRRDRKILRELL